jgi:predicted metal-binding protein
MTLLICRTCPRYDPTASGDFGRALTAAIAGNPLGDKVNIRNVQCLGGCPAAGVIAVDGPGKARVRFTGLDVDDTDAILDAVTAHDACPTGVPDEWEIPIELADRISSVTRKRHPFGTRPY